MSKETLTIGAWLADHAPRGYVPRTSTPIAPRGTWTSALVPIVRGADVIAAAIDTYPTDPETLVALIVGAHTGRADRRGNGSLTDMFGQCAETLAVSRESTDSLQEWVRRVIGHAAMAVTYDRWEHSDRRTRRTAAGEGSWVTDMDGVSRPQHTRTAAKRKRSNKGATVAVSDRSPLDQSERASVAHANVATRLTGIGLLGRVNGFMPREMTPVLAGVVETDDGRLIERGTDYVGAHVMSHVNVTASEPWRPTHRYGRRTSEMETADGRTLIATHHYCDEQMTDADGRECVKRIRYVVTPGHGRMLAPTAGKAVEHRHEARGRKAAAAAIVRDAIRATLLAAGTHTVGAVTVTADGTSTRGAVTYTIATGETVTAEHAPERSALRALMLAGAQ